MQTWTVGDKYDTYIATPGVAFDNTLKQIIEQKWIASWTAATEAWFDFRRTGLPALKAGPAAKRRCCHCGSNTCRTNCVSIKRMRKTP